jgi:hypothetical protein
MRQYGMLKGEKMKLYPRQTFLSGLRENANMEEKGGFMIGVSGDELGSVKCDSRFIS